MNARSPLSLAHRIAIGATMLAISEVEYRRRVEAGERHCSGHKDWHPRDAFGKRRTAPDGLDYVCKAFALARTVAYQRDVAAIVGERRAS